MEAVLKAVETAVPQLHHRPSLNSYGAGEEFSLYHWIEVCRLVDDSDAPLPGEGRPSMEKNEQA
jgi:hypothetical protein